MKILVYGAGVLGSLYAARLLESGNEVTILARGQRLADIHQHGVVLEEAGTGYRTATAVHTVEALQPGDAYDLVMVLVRKNQLADVLPSLAANTHTPNILFMLNNAAGWYDVVSALGWERPLLGFPGAGGTREGAVVRYALAPSRLQPTTIGEMDGAITPRLLEIAGLLTDAGFPTTTSRNMDAWLKTHAAVVTPLAEAIYAAGGNVHRLARTPDALILAVRSIKEGLRLLDGRGVPVTPWEVQALRYAPEPLLVAALGRVMDTEWAELMLANHANAARDEMREISAELAGLSRDAKLAPMAMRDLAGYADPQASPLPAGSNELPMDWRGVWLWLGGIAGMAAGLMIGARVLSGLLKLGRKLVAR